MSTRFNGNGMSKRIGLLRRRAWLAARLCLERDPFRRRVLRWWLDDPDEERRYVYDLTPDSMVLDVGGYRGAWTREIVRRYRPYVHCFEPVPSFARDLERQFAGEPKVAVHAFGLADRDCVQTIMQAADASSTFIGRGIPVTAEFRDVAGFFSDAHLDEIALMKINIEGGEYPLLLRMIEKDLVSRCRDIQVQFHEFAPDAHRQRETIREALARTHVVTYEYAFVWENWRRRR
jgi:FkbM family methyltransferase